ncbi:MAG: hypothetical protein K2H06_03090 [Anaeroplasmataceae bacterium]|nr:hypothetical protein [Anaeroplasmataceae bacterium]
MHFIRNRLTSIANLLEFLRLSPDEWMVIPADVVRDLYRSASHDYTSIKKYADDLLNKEKYPFGDREVEEVSVQHLYVYLAETVEYHLKVYVDTPQELTKKNQKVVVNYFELKTILTDWISNMERYGSGYGVEWILDNESLTITFSNTAKSEKCDRVVNALSNDNVEIRHTRKQTFGVNIIRELAAKNNIAIIPTIKRIENTERDILVVSFKIPVKNEE